MKLTKDSRYNQDLVNEIMEYTCNRGIFIDIEEAEKVYKKLIDEINSHEELAREELCEDFRNMNLNSPAQVATVFVNQFQLEKYAKKTKKGNYSFGKEVLDKIIEKEDNKFAYHLKNYRSLTSLTKKLKEIVDCLDEDCRVHPQFKHCDTNRIHFNTPGLSNLNERIRPIIGVPEGRKLIKADYKSQEFYIAVNMLGIDKLKPIFEEGKDPYKEMVQILTGHEMKPEQRETMKTLWISGTYGSQFGGMNLDKDEKEFSELVLKEIENIPEMVEFKKYIDDEIIPYNKPIESYFGTIREFPTYERNKNRLKRIVFNNIMQITGADILFFAMESCNNKFKELGYTRDDILIYLSIHDELIFDVKEEIVTEELLENIRQAMTLDIEGWSKIKVNIEVTDNY